MKYIGKETKHSPLTITGSTLKVDLGANSGSTAIFTNNIQNGYPTSNPWNTGLNGSFFQNFGPETHVSEILRFMSGVLSASLDVADAAPNTKFWSSVSTTYSGQSTTSKSSLLNGVLGSTYENAKLSQHWTSSFHINMVQTASYRLVQEYLIDKGFMTLAERGSFGNDTGTNPFNGSYGTNIPSTILTNASFNSLAFTVTGNAGGSTIHSGNSTNFHMGRLTNGAATPFTVRVAASQSFSDTASITSPSVSSNTFHTQSFIDYTISDFGTSNGLVLTKIITTQPAVIPSAFQDGDFNNVAGVLSDRFAHSGSTNKNVISASGYYQMQDVIVGLKSGSQSEFLYKDGSNSTNLFYLYAGSLPSDITTGTPTVVISGETVTRTGFTATSRSLSGAPYILTANYAFSYQAEASKSFDPAYGYSTTVLTNSTPTDNWESIGSTTLATTTVSVTSNGVQTSQAGIRGVKATDGTLRSTSFIPFVSDISFCTSSLSTSIDSNNDNVVQNRSSQQSLNYTLGFRTTAVNWKGSSVTSNTATINFYTASLFKQPTASGSMAIYSRAQGYDGGSLTGTTEQFSGEDYRIQLNNNVVGFNGDAFVTSFQYGGVLGNYDLQVKPGFLVDPGGDYGYWYSGSFGSGTYKYYIRRFQTSGTKTSMTINVGKTLVNWNSSTDGVSAGLIFKSAASGSGGNSAQSVCRIYDPSATTSNLIEANISNDNHKNPFSSAISLYGNTGGNISSTTYTVPMRNADGMFLDNTDNELYVILRYKGDPAPVTTITVGFS